jgi:(p)ppGpp synthase/HD superfamily hydrolase
MEADRIETTTLSERFDDALRFASELHRRQLRKGTDVPYVAHLLSVTALVLEHGGTEDEAIAALLHDAIEDQGGATVGDEIRRRFGDAVVEIVKACSDTDETPKPPWRARKEAYLAHLPDATSSAKLVSAADKVHNARATLADYRARGESVWARFRGGREGTLWYYRELVTVFRGMKLPERTTQLIAELERVVRELETLSSGETSGTLT